MNLVSSFVPLVVLRYTRYGQVGSYPARHYYRGPITLGRSHVQLRMNFHVLHRRFLFNKFIQHRLA